MEKDREKISAILASIEGGYQLVRFIGQGSIGTVYECCDSDNRSVAVKLMESSPMMDRSIFECIIKSALATEKLSEEINIVKVFYAGKCGNFYYIIMEMMPGGTLETVVSNAGMPVSEKLEFGVKIAETISKIHQHGIVHGDLKPENILLSADDTPYLNDFYLYPTKDAGPMPSMPIGTPYYMSPEQARGAMLTPESDIYSFGVLFYELLTGRMPYFELHDNIQAMINEITESPVYPLRKANKKLGRNIEAVIDKLLEKKPQNRYPNMAVVSNDIKACIEDRPISIPYKKSFLQKIFS